MNRDNDLSMEQVRSSKKIRTGATTSCSMNTFMVTMALVLVQAIRQDGQGLLQHLSSYLGFLIHKNCSKAAKRPLYFQRKTPNFCWKVGENLWVIVRLKRIRVYASILILNRFTPLTPP